MGYLGLVPSERSTGDTAGGVDHDGRKRTDAPNAGREHLDIPARAWTVTPNLVIRIIFFRLEVRRLAVPLLGDALDPTGSRR